MTRILITGIGGFIGAHMMDHVLVNTDWEIVGLDSFRHKGLTDRIRESAHYQRQPERVTVLTHDLAAPISTQLMAAIGPIDYVVNFASDSHVDRSITDPVPFVSNNVGVMLTMLEYARVTHPKAFVQISTDEVFGAAPGDYAHHEWDVILPSNPYAASKAAQEAIAISYWRTYGVPLVLTNTMNNFGEGQDVEKFVPKVIRSVLTGETLQIHGSERSIGSRFYLHARNHADAVLWLLRNTVPALYPNAARPDRYNVVGECEVNNLDMATEIARIMGQPLHYELVDFHAARPGHDRRYALNGSKLAACGWTHPIALGPSLEKTVHWYAQHPEWLGAHAEA